MPRVALCNRGGSMTLADKLFDVVKTEDIEALAKAYLDLAEEANEAYHMGELAERACNILAQKDNLSAPAPEGEPDFSAKAAALHGCGPETIRRALEKAYHAGAQMSRDAFLAQKVIANAALKVNGKLKAQLDEATQALAGRQA